MSKTVSKRDFLSTNKQIAKALKSDLSLKSICTCEEIAKVKSKTKPYTLFSKINYSQESYTKNNLKKVLLYMLSNGLKTINLTNNNINLTEKEYNKLSNKISATLTEVLKEIQEDYLCYDNAISAIATSIQSSSINKVYKKLVLKITLKENYKDAIKELPIFIKKSGRTPPPQRSRWGMNA